MNAKRLLIAAAVLVPIPALAEQAQVDQNKTYTLVLTGQQILMLTGALGELPYRVASPVIETIGRQIIFQQQVQAPPPAGTSWKAPDPQPNPAPTPEEKPK